MTANTEWVSLRHAAEILGVHPATVRNWADKGELPSRRTPGGHRRFRKSDLFKMAEAQQGNDQTQTHEVQLILQNALGQARMQVGRDNLEAARWYSAMSDDTRQAMRTQGRRLLEEIRSYLAADEDDANLAAAIKFGKEYAHQLHNDGLTLPEAIRGFYYFSDFVMDSILNWSEISTVREHNDWAKLLRQVNTFTHSMLLSIVEYYEED